MMNTASLHNPSRFGKQSGVMLLEALIGVLIFSVGILAMIGLQAASISNNTNATYRSDASYLANQIIGQMWTDQANLKSYEVNAAAAVSCQANPSSSNCCPAGTSSSTNANVSSWLAEVYRLPQASTVQQSIAVDQPTHVVTIALCWQAPNEAGKHYFIASAQINGG